VRKHDNPFGRLTIGRNDWKGLRKSGWLFWRFRGSCLVLVDVAVSVPDRGAAMAVSYPVSVPPRAAESLAVASLVEFGHLNASRGLPLPGAPSLGAALASLANWVREHPEPDLPGRAKSTGGKPLKDREFRAKLQEEAKGPHTTTGALHWRMRRPHVPSTLPDRASTGDPAPPTSVPTGRTAPNSRDI